MGGFWHWSRWTRFVAMGAFLAVSPGQAPGQIPETPREIVDYVDRLLRGESSAGRITMNIETENWSRRLQLEVWSRGRDHAIIRVLSPRSEAGTATLMAEDQVWNYLPRADRTIKIPPSLMMGTWMGSHFTNDDLVKESQLIEDYDISLGYEGDRDGIDVWEFHLTPKPEAAVVWGRIEYQVRKGDMMPTWARYVDEDGEVARTMTFSDYTVMGGRLVPAVMSIVPTDKPGESTTVIYEDVEFDIELTDDFFSLRNLRSGR
jgi:outer membrane lipoprotein-sorting protein